MTLDLLIPFGILLALVIYFIYTRSKFEKSIANMYEQKFEEWKQNSDSVIKDKKICKELVGLVYKEEYNITIELLDDKVKSQIQRGKFSIKDK